MNAHEQLEAEWEIEPERYEFWEESGWNSRATPARLSPRSWRRFARSVPRYGRRCTGIGRQPRRGQGGQRCGFGEALPREIDAWVHIGEEEP